MARKLFFLVLMCSTTALITCTNGGSGGAGAGLQMKLIHVDAKGNYTAEELVRRAVAAGKQRLAFLDAAMAGGGGVGLPVHWATLQYVAEYLIGDPPQRVEALIDTGSDLIWTQCSTCLRKVCAKQSLPYYNSSASSTFAPVPCAAKICAANDDLIHFCDLAAGCSVIAGYGAGAVAGTLGSEAFAFQSGTAELAFGCVTFTRIIQGALQGASGLIGLGRGRLSLVSQTGATKFSYCLTPYFHNNGATGHLFVGASASLGGGHGDVMTTPFVKGPKGSPFYYLPLVGLTVGETRLPIPSTVFDLREIAPGFFSGGVIIDSGSPFTSLVHDAYDALAAELTAQLNGSLVAPPAGDDGDGDTTTLCVARREVGRVVPAVVFHFRGGADMAVPAENYWAPVDKATACMVIGSAGPYRRQSVIGNYQQQNMRVLYDLANGDFSFQAADCTAL
uniref:Peptidase A1 domain-containing protein n=1 Tax=Oryza punctata TaxID=4537 RepID=A0A0E0MP27_ORYPU